MQPSFAVSPPRTNNRDDADSATLTVVTTQRQQITILSVEGNIDLLTTPQLSEAVSAALSEEPRCLIIDLTKTVFLASTGMQVFLTAQAAISHRGYFGIVADGPSTARPMKLMGLEQTLTISPTLDDAITVFTDLMQNASRTQHA